MTGLRSICRAVYKLIPNSLKPIAQTCWQKIPFTQEARQRKWVIEEYTEFARQQRQYLMMSIARF